MDREPAKSESTSSAGIRGVRVALLTNSLSPHSLPLCEFIKGGVGEFCAFLSSASDRYHDFPEVEARFPIVVQRSFNALKDIRRAHGYWQTGEFHVPFDTLRQLRSYKPDVILSVQLGIRTALSVFYRRAHPKSRLILWATLSDRTEENRGFLRLSLRRWILRRVDAAFVNGRGGEAYLRSLGYSGKLYMVPYAIDDAPFVSNSYLPDSSVCRVVYAGKFVPQKGLREFCHHVNEWCKTNPGRIIELELVGGGPEEGLLRKMVCVPNFRLSIFPKVSQTELAARYHRADIFAFPTLGDEWGVVVNEAMIAGLPVLGSRYSQAVMEMVQDNVSGWIFDPSDPGNTYAALDRAFKMTPEDLTRMSASAKESIRRISPHAIAARALLAIEEVSASAQRKEGAV